MFVSLAKRSLEGISAAPGAPERICERNEARLFQKAPATQVVDSAPYKATRGECYWLWTPLNIRNRPITRFDRVNSQARLHRSMPVLPPRPCDVSGSYGICSQLRHALLNHSIQCLGTL